MRWEVTGTDRTNGASVLRVYEAPTEEAAAEFATRDGINVGGVDLLIEMGGFTAPPAVNVPPPPPVRSWRVEGANRESGEAVTKFYDATSDAEAAVAAREDGIHVIRVTRADQPAPPSLNPYQAQFAAITAPADPLALRGDPPAAATNGDDGPLEDGPSASHVAGFSTRDSRRRESAIPHEFRRPDRAPTQPQPAPSQPAQRQQPRDGGFQPLDPAALAAVEAASDVIDWPTSTSSSSPRAAASRAASPAAPAETEHPRLQAGATATFAFACAAYGIGGAAALTAVVLLIVAAAKQGTPAAAESLGFALVAAQVAAPALFAAVVCHAVSGACLALLEVVLRRRRKREY